MSALTTKLTLVCTFAVLCTALSGCRDSIREVGGYKCADFVEAKVYYGRAPAVRLAEIGAYPLEKQYAVFICGVLYVRPSSWDGAQPFMERGGSTIEFLKMKLVSAQKDLEINSIVALIDRMNESGSYTASEDTQLMQALDTSVSRIRDPQSRQESEMRLQRIRGQRTTNEQ